MVNRRRHGQLRMDRSLSPWTPQDKFLWHKINSRVVRVVQGKSFGNSVNPCLFKENPWRFMKNQGKEEKLMRTAGNLLRDPSKMRNNVQDLQTRFVLQPRPLDYIEPRAVSQEAASPSPWLYRTKSRKNNKVCNSVPLTIENQEP